MSDLQAEVNLARDRFEMGKFDEAKDVVEEVLKARRRLQMGNNRTIIATRLQLAEWHRAMAQYKHTEGLYAKCLQSCIPRMPRASRSGQSCTRVS